MNEYTAAVITVSDKGFQGLRTDTSGPACSEMLKEAGWTVQEYTIVPDEPEDIKKELIRCCDDLSVCLAVTTGGTGFAKRDTTPEATLEVIERETRGIPEAMRAESMKVTPRGMLSRGVAGIRGDTLIVNLPGSEKAAKECLGAVLPALKHGVEMLRGWSSECASHHHHHE
jgi:molybdopterin adenylyltransferase